MQLNNLKALYFGNLEIKYFIRHKIISALQIYNFSWSEMIARNKVLYF